MLSLDDPMWTQLNGAYRSPYDPSSALKRLQAGSDATSIWKEFWDNLHHQGDVDEASYAAVPRLVEIQKERRDLGWNLYALASTIEIERHSARNPPLPAWIRNDYDEAWRHLLTLALGELERSDDKLLIRATLATLAIAKGLVQHGALILNLDDFEVDALLNQHRTGI